MLHRIYGSTEIDEPYQCSYGLNPGMLALFQNAPLAFSAFSISDDAVRAFELTDHCFFVGTLFQPERSALKGDAHPLISAFVEAAAASINL